MTKQTAARTTERVAIALPRLLEEGKLSLRQAARAAGVDVAHLSRVVSGSGGKAAGADLAVRLARALDLPEHYFPEAREQAVINAVRADPELRERIYRRL
jgi:transcriptional regulator with XRE-family HTH domain